MLCVEEGEVFVAMWTCKFPCLYIWCASIRLCDDGRVFSPCLLQYVKLAIPVRHSAGVAKVRLVDSSAHD